ncbi:hypothetical protein PACTADRAFT_50403 [Pachysolen tannophilus NRRL Y-2460]|uniref:Aspartate/glutamate racemase family protein n=1 Tax=Pachysolen tannophilus NRRL Y-2460 TaxID=669874 RepID=A0A1E4TS27_PACTA|nr:hypothetical protein PACTADRAFT_50403 [Pachysolen tannophilus NRRL Y-2460]
MSYYPSKSDLKPLGAICLDYTDDIHRPPGDPLNEESFSFPLVHEMVSNATLWKIVQSEPYTDEFLQYFVDACEKLAEKGAIGIITSCGFLAQVQKRLSSKISLPLASSSLLQIPQILCIRPENEHVGVITFDESVLSDVHFDGVGITSIMRKRINVIGVPENGALRGVIRDGKPYIHEELKLEMIQCAIELIARNHQIKVIVLECTQMPPFARAIQEVVRLPVYDVITMIDWFYSGLNCRSIPEDKNKEAGLRKRLRSGKEKK